MEYIVKNTLLTATQGMVLLVICSSVVLSLNAAQTEAYLLPSFIEAQYDTNARSGWKQYLNPAPSTAERHRPAWRVFETEQQAADAIGKHSTFRYACSDWKGAINAKTANQYGETIANEYQEAHQQFNRVSKDRRSCYKKLAILGLCSAVCGGILGLSTTGLGKAGSSLFAIHGFYSFCRNFANFWSVREERDPGAHMISTLKDDFFDDNISLRRILHENNLRKVTSVGEYCLYVYATR